VLGNVHFFAGTLEDAKLFWDMGYSTSYTGVLTFTHQYDEVVKHSPCEFLHAETDAPYVAPVPYRGQRNEPLYVREVVRRMAEIRRVDVDILQEILIKNAERLYGIA
jgi:TatD DNase family protein